ncbi:MAG: DUF1800 domain-containing protein [Armatimonadetes bacterium]|nr:DUF1800 domain-containing protein [Armatimonadota bacterium]
MAERTEREKVAHLLRRFGLGASEAEVDYYGNGGLKRAIDRLLDYESVDEHFPATLEHFQQPDKKIFNVRGIQAWWVTRLLMTRRPLQEKMTLFWHDHFATSASKVNAPLMMYQQNELLRRNATGSFKTLLLEASKDPAMLFWLDNQFNVRGKANENFAREIMELFTLGIGNYTEKDIQESARAFTGWTILRRRPTEANEQDPYRQADFLYRPMLHDNGEKRFLGKSGDFSGEDIIDILCDQARTAYYITEKIWEWFAYPKPELSLINRLAGNFRKTGLDVKKLLRDIMESEEFYSEKAFRAVYKNPVDFCVATVRQLGLGETAAANVSPPPKEGETPNPRGQAFRLMAQATSLGMNGMGMDLLFPPDVAGWDGGAAWITSATMVERIQWADTLFDTAPPAQPRVKGVRAPVRLRYPAMTLFGNDPTPEGVAKKLVSVFDVQLSQKKMGELAEAARSVCGARVTQQNANATAVKVCRLIFGSPEFQMA